MLQFWVGVSYSYSEYDPEYYDTVQGVVRIEQKITEDLNFSFLHSSSLKNGFTHDKQDVNLFSFELKLK